MNRLLPLLTLATPLLAAAQDVPAGTQWAQVMVRERIIIRIPRLAPLRRTTLSRTMPVAPSLPKVKWKEHRGPECVAIATLAGAAITDDGDVDLVTASGTRMRAKMDDDCPSLDFYSGFYIKPAIDGKLCADRDELRARSGRACAIDRFRRLSLKTVKP